MLDYLLIGSQGPAERALRTYVGHHNGERPHRGLLLQVPKPTFFNPAGGRIERHDVLGGLIHEHRRAALPAPWRHWPAAGAYDRSVVLRCTKKLLAVIGPSAISEPVPAPNPEDWYANLLWFDRRKCLLLTHVGTLFTILETDITASDLRSTGPFVFILIKRELLSEGLPPDVFDQPDSENFVLAKSTDRSVLGCMNDMALMCEHAITESGGLLYTDLAALNHSLRRNINSARNYERPIDLARERFGAQP